MPSPRTKSGQKRLSELARHVCQPKGIIGTGWRPVRDRSAQFGIKYDRWQDGLGRLALAKREDGSYAASVGGVVVSIPRQTGKTFLFGWMVFALCTLFPNLTVVWTAHRTRTSDETFEKMRSMAQKPKVAAYLDGKPRSANGQQTIKFKNGSRILFGAREQGFGRGFDEIDVLVFDEAQILTESALSDMVPATNAAANGLVLMMGTPPRPKDPGEAFSNRRADGLAGDADTLYVEFSADRDAKIIDWGQLAAANPSFPHRTSRTAVLRMQKLLGSEDSFRREALGIWDETAKDTKAVEWAKWRRLTVDPSEAPTVGRVAYAVRFSVDGLLAGLAAARDPGGGLPVHVEGIEVFDMTMGIRPIVDFLVARADRAVHIVVDGKSGAELLVQALRDRGVRNKKLIVRMTPDLVTAACAGMLQALTDMGLSHIGQPLLDEQVRVAVPRKIGNYGGFGWDAPEGKRVVLFEAVTYAHHAVKTSKSRRGLMPRRGVVLT